VHCKQVHLDAQVVSSWGVDFNVEEVERVDTEILSAITTAENREYIEMVCDTYDTLIAYALQSISFADVLVCYSIATLKCQCLGRVR
jgi:hypothetical protein